MPSVRRHRSNHSASQPCMPIRFKILSLLCMIFGPLLLVYLALRCEKNQCILFQLPLVIPTHFSAYWSPLALLIVLGFIGLMFLLSSASGPDQNEKQSRGDAEERDTIGLSTGIIALVFMSLLLITLAYLKPDYIHIVHGEYLRMLMITTMVCLIISITLFVLALFDILPDRTDDLCSLMSFFYGNSISVHIGHVELKYFFYVHVGLVAWGLLDLLIVLNVITERTITAPVAFLMISQFLVVGHMLLYENFIQHCPFVTSEGLGFFWLMRVLMYSPFFHSLPLYYAATTEIVLSKPAILADCVFFLFGFVIYISSLHQRQNFINDPKACKRLKSIAAVSTGRRLLTSGYWGIVQKPDYLGYVIMWTSWTVACGFSGLSFVVLVVNLGTVYMWLRQSTQYKKDTFGPAWIKYSTQVPKLIIPHVF